MRYRRDWGSTPSPSRSVLLIQQAATLSDCPVPEGAVKVALGSGLPFALRDAMGDIALPGEPV
jgi:hypothetical protein